MSFLREHCSLFSVNEPKELEGFNCGDLDIDEFFANDCFGFTKQLLGKTYCYRLKRITGTGTLIHPIEDQCTYPTP